MNWRAAVCAGIAAGVISTLAELLLWAIFTDGLPRIVYRDARLAAALVLGIGALDPPASFDLPVMLAATLVHFALSIVYAGLLAVIIARLCTTYALFAGALFGMALYAVNLYGFTALFPWFDVARGGITYAAHVAFGVSAAATYRLVSRR